MACSNLDPLPRPLSGRSGSFRATKKGLKWPLDHAPPRLAGGSSTHGGAPGYENQRREGPHEPAISCSDFLISIAAAPVKPNAAGIWRAVFKRTFEIGRSRQTAIVEQSRASQRSRDFAPSRPANCPRELVCSPNRTNVSTCAASPLEGN